MLERYRTQLKRLYGNIRLLENHFNDYNCIQVYCPRCNILVEGSEYLFTEAFPDDYYSYWIACLVMHHRHEHISYYDNSWRFYHYGSKNKEYGELGYEDYKKLINNRAKREMVRGSIKSHRLNFHDKVMLTCSTLNLKYNDSATLDFIFKTLNKLYLERIKQSRYDPITHNDDCCLHIDLNENLEYEYFELILPEFLKKKICNREARIISFLSEFEKIMQLKYNKTRGKYRGNYFLSTNYHTGEICIVKELI